MIKNLVFLAAAAVMVLGHAVHTHDHDAEQSSVGVAHLEGEFGHNVVKGDLTFTMVAEDKMVITGTITGMPPGHYGLNVHESGDISNGCSGARGHFNPHGHDHGHPDDEHRHVGDLGNILFNEEGVAYVKIEDRLPKLWGTEGIVGRTIALASMKDDHGRGDHPSSKIDGHGGDLVACGVIGIQ